MERKSNRKKVTSMADGSRVILKAGLRVGPGLGDGEVYKQEKEQRRRWAGGNNASFWAT